MYTASLTLAQSDGNRGRNSYPRAFYHDNSAHSPHGSHFYSFSNFASGNTYINETLIAHAVLASLAFVIFFPIGAILIRLASFRGLWLIHGLFQLFAYLTYTAAFGLGVHMIRTVNSVVNYSGGLSYNMFHHYHPVIGILLFALLFFQPILGWLHHTKFRKYERRTVWSYAHIWLGRILIPLGMINGGLGMLFASEMGFMPASVGWIIAYSIAAGLMWLLWMLSAGVGERKRMNALRAEALWKEAQAPGAREQVPAA